MADVNGDGKPDLVVGEQTSSGAARTRGTGQVAVLLGIGDGKFKDPILVTTPNSSQSLVVSDFNADGILDLATASYWSSDVSVFLGSGNGHFRAAGNFAAEGAYGISACDFNGDGEIDLVAAGYATTLLTNTSR